MRFGNTALGSPVTNPSRHTPSRQHLTHVTSHHTTRTPHNSHAGSLWLSHPLLPPPHIPCRPPSRGSRQRRSSAIAQPKVSPAIFASGFWRRQQGQFGYGGMCLAIIHTRDALGQADRIGKRKARCGGAPAPPDGTNKPDSGFQLLTQIRGRNCCSISFFLMQKGGVLFGNR
jgi:hypothetical protein